MRIESVDDRLDRAVTQRGREHPRHDSVHGPRSILEDATRTHAATSSRSDVLYEMLTGTPAFSGSSKATIMAAILEREPQPIREIQPEVPPQLEYVVNKCLSKQPDERWQSAYDVAEQLRWIRESGAPSVKPARRAVNVVAIAVAASLIALAAIWSLTLRHEPDAVVRLSIPLAQGGNDLPPLSLGIHSGLPNVAITPDGKRIAYAADRNGISRLYVRQLESFETIALDATGGGPFFSPDGQWIGFTRLGSLMKVPAAGGAVRLIANGLVGVGRGATWSADGTIYFAPGRAAASGRSPRMADPRRR